MTAAFAVLQGSKEGMLLCVAYGAWCSDACSCKVLQAPASCSLLTAAVQETPEQQGPHCRLKCVTNRLGLSRHVCQAHPTAQANTGCRTGIRRGPDVPQPLTTTGQTHD